MRSQIENLDTKVEIAVEDYNAAADRYAKLTRQVRRAEVRLGSLRAKMGKLQKALDTRATRMYRSGPLGFLEVLLNARSFEDFTTTWDVLTDLSDHDAATISALKVAKKQSEDTHRQLKTAQAAASRHKKATAASRRTVLGRLAERKRTLASISADIRGMVAAQRAAEDAAARRAFYASHSGGFYDTGGDPPSNASRGEKVVFYAMSQRGKPYRWGATGPDSYDCSGLTSWAYSKVGVSLPRVSREQINAGARVSRANLEPGDLVFFGSPIHHVGIYIGNGQFVHAPSSGDVVKVSSLSARRNYSGACRP